MLDLDEVKENLKGLQALMLNAGKSLNIPKMSGHLKALELKKDAPDFWNDISGAQKINREAKNIADKITEYNTLTGRIDNALGLIEMCLESGEHSLADEIRAEERALADLVEKLYLNTLLKGTYDQNNAILTLHAGAGGTESQDWVNMLYRMYSRYCETSGYKTTRIDYLEGEGGGIKSITFSVSGRYAYGYLKAEKGVHRLVRISPFDSAKRRHTSFASVEVMPEIDEDCDITINPEELRIDTYRSSGAGGQHVNKTESAIRITHIPSGIVATCQTERSQIQNRATAMSMLKSKLAEKKEQEQLNNLMEIKGDIKKIEWGSQIRSYVFCPYTLVKDHRTGKENSNVTAVMDGDIHGFINDFLVKRFC
jgi:peptide chain release factor 2